MQARLASLAATRARVERMLAAEQAELETALAHLLAHARCRSSEHAAADQMAAAMHALGSEGAHGAKARGVTQLYTALQLYCEATDARERLEQQSAQLLGGAADGDEPLAPLGGRLDAVEATAAAHAAASREAVRAAAHAAAPVFAATPAATVATVAWPPSEVAGAVAPADDGPWAAPGERVRALWSDVDALQHSIDAEAAELQANGGRGGGGAEYALRTPATVSQEPPRGSSREASPLGESPQLAELQSELRAEQQARLQAEEQAADLIVQNQARNEVLEARLRELEAKLQAGATSMSRTTSPRGSPSWA